MSVMVFRYAGARWRFLANSKIAEVDGMLADSKPVRPGELRFLRPLLNQARRVAQTSGNVTRLAGRKGKCIVSGEPRVRAPEK